MWATYGPSGPVKLQSKLPPTFASTPSGHAEAQSRALAPRAQLRTGDRLRMSSARLSDELPAGGRAAEGHAGSPASTRALLLVAARRRRGAARSPLLARGARARLAAVLARAGRDLRRRVAAGARPAARRRWLGPVLAAQRLEEISQPATSAGGCLRVLRRLAQVTQALSHDRALGDRPRVRGDPVHEHAGRQLPGDRDEQEGQRDEDHPLRLVHRRVRREQEREELRADVEHDQCDEHGARGATGQVRDEEEVRSRRLAARLWVRRAGRIDAGADVVPQVGAQQVVQREEDRQLRQRRQDRPERVDPVLLVERQRLPLEALRVRAVLVAQLLDLWRELGHPVHRAQLLERQRQQQGADEHRERDDRETPAQPDVVVEDLEDRLEDVDQRLEDVGESSLHWLRSLRRYPWRRAGGERQRDEPG